MEHRTTIETITALRAGAVSSVELTEAAIARIEARDGAINAVVVRDFDRALAAAWEADTARSQGEDGPLLGVPLTVKEAFNVAGLPTTWGLPGTQGIPVTQDAVAVARLKAAGAIILGKTNTPVMLGDWQSANPVYGVSNNPWDLARTPGGSTGGGAAALAAGFTPLEFGSDLAGSLRIPAAFCGVYAHRPSYGLVPQRGFVPPGVPVLSVAPAIDQSVLGPMARSAEDLGLALSVTAGPDDRDATGYELRLPPPRHDRLRDFRVLVIETHPMVPTQADIGDALSQLASQLEAAGCRVGRNAAAVPDLAAIANLHVRLLMSAMSADSPDDAYAAAAARAAAFGPQAQDMAAVFARAQVMSHRDWIAADRERAALQAQWRACFADWDIVLCPVAPTTAFAHDHAPMEARMLDVDGAATPYSLTSLWASVPTPSGNPATAMPVGLDADGLPIGVQAIGPHLEDLTSIAFARLCAQAFGGFVAPPAATRPMADQRSKA
jgi:amidase